MLLIDITAGKGPGTAGNPSLGGSGRIKVTMTDAMAFIYFKLLYHELGRLSNVMEKSATQKFWNDSPVPRICYDCQKHIKWGDRSIDHIIPRSICWQLGLVNLIYDPRNFRLAHGKCNIKRANSITGLPPIILAKLQQLGYS